MIKMAMRIIKISMIRFFRDHLTYQASALSYITLLAIVPIISVMFYFVSLFPIFSDLILLSQYYIYHNFLPESSERIEAYITQFVNQASQLPMMSILFSLLTGLLAMMTVEETLDKIWGLTFKTRIWVKRLTAWGILLIIPFFIGFVSFIVEYLLTIISPASYFQLEIAVVHFVINTFIFAIIYIFVPNKAINFKDGLLAGFIAAILFELVRQFFQLYIGHFSSYQIIYGALSFLPIFFIWIYCAWCIIIFSALLVHTKTRLSQHKP